VGSEGHGREWQQEKSKVNTWQQEGEEDEGWGAGQWGRVGAGGGVGGKTMQRQSSVSRNIRL